MLARSEWDTFSSLLLQIAELQSETMKLLLVALSLVCVLQLALASCQWPMCRYQTMLKASDLVTGGDASRFNTADMGSLYLNKDFVDPDNYNFQGGWPLYRFVMMQRRGK
ncbi:hypothetical protein QR680_006836 [Steinernema hermaphroditum]|uniref:Uncharacterized protein n=1 Tax=Steinernema hermaphroditum TaxID=289476 RepID=A0AA39HY44_9BILA|nr:hypothetical protein QR680_006836 [Steinernema hermaphroditum]